MVTVEELKNSVSRNDVEGFLRTFLLLILQGTTLSLPKSRLKDDLLIEWKDCIPKNAQFYTDDFIAQLSSLWIEVLTEQGGKPSDRFLEELLTILNNKIKKTIKKESIDPLLNEVSLNVSDDYYNDKKAREDEIFSVDILLTKVHESLKRERTDLFLISYLAIVIEDKNYKIPKITIPEKIQAQWRRIISQQLKLKHSLEFLERLSKRWFYILNKKGIPSTNEQIKEVLYFVKANAKEDKVKQIKATSNEGGFFSRLFNKKS
ncbi:hypothetical protein DID80_01770 [Candidatus Marinamargulisbacteria bacterium SCGC AAA071-K20]|nr:hypothetical protein DID80_01770 [Candidatus Marinamargulisbacteria bacterium SCGC AAA071-K20]